MSFRSTYDENHGNLLMAIAGMILAAGFIAIWVFELYPLEPQPVVRLPLMRTSPARESISVPGPTRGGSNDSTSAAPTPPDANGGTSNSVQEASNGPMLTVEVDGIIDVRGQCLIAIYDHEETFNNPGRAVWKTTVKVTEKSLQVTVPGLYRSRYAIAVVHDVDEDGALTKNIAGIPTEPYGYSRQARGLMGPPEFEEAAIVWEGKAITERVHVY
jgi:uncharacterized protein (DUF2141 family)